jgi:hypothetical protein
LSNSSHSLSVICIFCPSTTEPLHGSNAGTQLIVTMKDLRREAGRPGHLSDIPPSILGSAALIDCLIKHLLLRLQVLGIRLEDPMPKLSIKREGNTFLMEYFLRSPLATSLLPVSRR